MHTCAYGDQRTPSRVNPPVPSTSFIEIGCLDGWNLLSSLGLLARMPISISLALGLHPKQPLREVSSKHVGF